VGPPGSDDGAAEDIDVIRAWLRLAFPERSVTANSSWALSHDARSGGTRSHVLNVGLPLSSGYQRRVYIHHDHLSQIDQLSATLGLPELTRYLPADPCQPSRQVTALPERKFFDRLILPSQEDPLVDKHRLKQQDHERSGLADPSGSETARRENTLGRYSLTPPRCLGDNEHF
jgi:hypothetical protein